MSTAPPPSFEFSDDDDNSSKSPVSSVNYGEVDEDDNESMSNLSEDLDSDNENSAASLGGEMESVKVFKNIPDSFSPDKDSPIKGANGKMNIYAQPIKQSDVNYLSTIFILNSIVSCKCSKSNNQGFGCLAQISSSTDQIAGSLKDSIALVNKIRGDLLAMTEAEKHKYVEKMLMESEIKGNSGRLMVKYCLHHPDFRNGKCL